VKPEIILSNPVSAPPNTCTEILFKRKHLTIQKHKVAVIANIPSPYRVDFYNALELSGELDFKVFFLSETESNRDWEQTLGGAKFSYEVLTGIHAFWSKREWPVHLNPSIFFKLLRYSPNVVVTTGYDAIGYWLGLAYAKIMRRKLVTWYGSTKNDQTTTTGPVNTLRSYYLRNSAGFFTYGRAATASLQSKGVQSSRIVTGLNTVDMAKIRDSVSELRSAERIMEERNQYPEFLFLYAGQLIERKRVDLLLDAFSKIDPATAGLIIAGSGSDLSSLQDQAKKLALNNVWFESFRQYDEMPDLYALADALVLPSDREVWGLVVNEGLAGGLYSIVSDAAGCSGELVSNPLMGQSFHTSSADDLSEAMRDAVSNGESIARSREKRAETAVVDYGLHHYVSSFEDAVKRPL
jgi:glycosyltransferase involved in cell wall biosynthesis